MKINKATIRDCILLLVLSMFVGHLLYTMGESPKVEQTNIVPDSMFVMDADENDLQIPNTSDMIRYLNPKVDIQIANLIAKSIDTHRGYFPKELIVSLIFRESSFRPLLISSADCFGLMQINPKSHKEKVKDFKRYELFYIDTNIKIGCKILKEYYEKNDSIKDALIRYLGANNKKYMEDIMFNFANLMMINTYEVKGEEK